MNEQKVIDYINNWFIESRDDKNRWNRGLGKSIKTNLQQIKQWKYHSRGNQELAKKAREYNSIHGKGAWAKLNKEMII